MMTFEEFERDWLRRHKGSIIPRPRVSSWGLIFGLCLWALIATGAALVSGAHSVPAILVTIPTVVISPYREGLSLFGFTIFELLIFAGALYRRANRYAAWGLLVALIGALAANVGSSINAVSANEGAALEMIVAVVLALIAPLAAFLAGEMVHHLYEQHRAVIDRAQEGYEQKRRDLDAVINREWVRYSKRLSGQTDNQTDRPTLSDGILSGQTDKTDNSDKPVLPDRQQPAAFGYNRTADGQKTVMEYLDANPDHARLPSRKLSELMKGAGLSVGHDTANRARNAWAAARQPAATYSNGHSTHEGLSDENHN